MMHVMWYIDIAASIIQAVITALLIRNFQYLSTFITNLLQISNMHIDQLFINHKAYRHVLVWLD